VDVTLNQLRVFREVARQGQFTRAAAALFVSQPAVSKCVKDLERQAGLSLVEQAGKRLRLTEAGEMLLAHAERMLAELADAERALAGLRSGDAGRLVIGASSTPGTYLLPQLLGDLRRTHPQVEVLLRVGDTSEVLERVVGGRLDLGVVGEAQFDPALHVELFRRDRLVLILGPSHPLGARERVTLADLAGEPFVLREPGSNTREVLERALRERNFRPRVVMELGSMEAIKKTVSAGLGISFVSEYAVGVEQTAGVLLVRPTPDLALQRGLHAIWRSSLRLTPLHERFLTALRAAAA
jgi:DNA-binding transcriptional LysR family regulator